MLFDLDNPVVALCAAGMQVDGEPAQALALFEQAWAARTDDFEASVAAHFLARHQATPADTVEWNERALRHADALDPERAAPLLPSLCLNLADAYRLSGRVAEARTVAARAETALAHLPANGYTEFVRMGLTRLLARLDAAGG